MKRLFVAACILLCSGKALACDVCGCSLGGNYFGILPLYGKNFVGLRWSQAKFHAKIAATQYLAAQHSEDTYSKAELWGRYYIAKRIQLFAFVPYVYNDMNGTDQDIKANGLGDINLAATYVILDQGERKGDLKQTLMAGGGIKLPTGEFDLEDQGTLVNRNFQMGTGSLDFTVNAVYTVRYKKTGLNLETGYKMNTENADGYLFGNQFRASAQAFYWGAAGSLSFLPHAGTYFEQSAMHQDNGIFQVNTGGTALMATAGLDINTGRVTVGFNFQRPISQNYNSDELAEITGKDRWTAMVTYSF